MEISRLLMMLFAGVIMLFTACSEEEVQAPSLIVNPNADPIEFSAAATETFQYSINTNQLTWDAVSDQSWCIVTKAKSGKSFTITALQNTSLTATPVIATVTVTADNATPIDISVTQKIATEYTITLSDDGNGTAAANVLQAIHGAEITITATPNSGYMFKRWVVVNGSVTLANTQANPTTFTLLSSKVEVKAEFVQDNS